MYIMAGAGLNFRTSEMEKDFFLVSEVDGVVVVGAGRGGPFAWDGLFYCRRNLDLIVIFLVGYVLFWKVLCCGCWVLVCMDDGWVLGLRYTTLLHVHSWDERESK